MVRWMARLFFVTRLEEGYVHFAYLSSDRFQLIFWVQRCLEQNSLIGSYGGHSFLTHWSHAAFENRYLSSTSGRGPCALGFDMPIRHQSPPNHVTVKPPVQQGCTCWSMFTICIWEDSTQGPIIYSIECASCLIWRTDRPHGLWWRSRFSPWWGSCITDCCMKFRSWFINV